MNNIFFWADTHFSHDNIRKYCNRPFKTIKEMDDVYIERWNSTVRPNDIIYFLGDFAFDNAKEIFYSLNGQKFLVVGNHDKHDVLKLPWLQIRDSIGLQIDKEYIWLNHYPHRSWNRSFHGSWHLYGHVHGKLEHYGKSLDVGADVLERPISFDDLKVVMKDRPLIVV
ncbi:metallophosphoesterase [Candidatus Pacearchaeota archaeon]|nr:metallophosphoesterase [Candidatus Pacearchaeota archaeon]